MLGAITHAATPPTIVMTTGGGPQFGTPQPQSKLSRLFISSSYILAVTISNLNNASAHSRYSLHATALPQLMRARDVPALRLRSFEIYFKNTVSNVKHINIVL